MHSCFEVDTCESGGSFTNLNYIGGQNLNLFPTLTFPCGGLLSSWTVQTPLNVSETIFLSVWREIGTYQYRQVGVNPVQISEAGLHTYVIPEADRIRVSRSHFIGIYHRTSGIKGLISYSANTAHNCFSSRLRSGDILANDGVINETIYGNVGYNYVNKTPSFRATVIPGQLQSNNLTAYLQSSR